MNPDFTIEELRELPRLFRFGASTPYFNSELMKRFEESFLEFIELEEAFEKETKT